MPPSHRRAAEQLRPAHAAAARRVAGLHLSHPHQPPAPRAVRRLATQPSTFRSEQPLGRRRRARARAYAAERI
eukprot:7380193-Prymnesium_polylepis.1